MTLLETIQVRDGQLQALPYHTARFNRTNRALFSPATEQDLGQLLVVPETARHGIVRCRVVYGAGGIQEVTFTPYVFKPIQRLKLVELPTYDYTYKWTDRQVLAQLLAENADFDEVIITRNGYLTDATIANLALFDGQRWFTPATPLLAGTKRAQLLDRGELTEVDIHVTNLNQFQHICLINAFRELRLADSLPVTQVV